jgi:hypothetical protein
MAMSQDGSGLKHPARMQALPWGGLAVTASKDHRLLCSSLCGTKGAGESRTFPILDSQIPWRASPGAGHTKAVKSSNKGALTPLVLLFWTANQ